MLLGFLSLNDDDKQIRVNQFDCKSIVDTSGLIIF